MNNLKGSQKRCSKCNEKKDRARGYYLSSSDIINDDGRLPICKDCLSEIVDMDNPRSLINVMRAVDRPFLINTYHSSLEKANSLGEYMRMLATPQNREKTYLDSVFTRDLEEYSNNRELRDFNENISISADEYDNNDLNFLKKKWGDFSPEDYEFLEDYYREYTSSYDTDTPVQIMLYKNIAKIHLQAGKELSDGNVKSYKDLMDLSSKLHTDGNIKPLQNSGANADMGVSTYGLWIKEVENEEPCEYFKDKPTYEDYDNFQLYWEKWFVRPFKNIFGISKDFDVGDDKDGKL